jgi:hypothetical protein
VVAAAAVAGEVAVAVVAVAADVVAGLAVTTIPSATAAGKLLAIRDNVTFGSRFPKSLAFIVDRFLFSRHLFFTDHGRALMSRLDEVR